MEDTQIIELYWDRDDRAIACTDEKYGPYCYTVAQRILDSREDSEECVNDTWLHAWNAMPPQRPGFLRMFLAAITRNLSFDRVRAKQAVKRGGGALDLALEELSECVAGSGSVEDEAIAASLAESVNAFLALLPDEARNVFLRRYFFLESGDEIARRYGLRPNSVRVSLHRTRDKLREHLRKEGFLE